MCFISASPTPFTLPSPDCGQKYLSQVPSTLQATSHVLTHLLLIPKKHLENQFINSPHASMHTGFALATSSAWSTQPLAMANVQRWLQGMEALI